ncbi:MAG: DUF4139 domain-containing protein [Anaerolineae bacterium]|jgi:hypothetical protein|nr:DUF4139 domain-containing protein [Anaerolineae bacterium]
MRARFFWIFSIVALLLVSLSLIAAQEATPEATETPETDEESAEMTRNGVSVTIYNQGSALIQDRRTFTFAAGENVINFTDVAATIDATSVNFKSLTDPIGTMVMEQNYVFDLVDTSALLARYIDQVIVVTMMDGTVYTGTLLSGRNGSIILQQDNGEVVVLSAAQARDVRFPQLPSGLITRPTLRWQVFAGQAGEQQVELTYLASGMGWTADYNVLLAQGNQSLDLNGWVTLTNTSGAAYRDAQVKLIAGDVNRIMPEVLRVAEFEMDMAVPAAAPEPVQQREFFEYQLYEIPRPVTVGDNETKQVEFVSGTNIAAKTFFVYDASAPFYGYFYVNTDQYYNQTGITTIGNYLEFSTAEESGLGADLPAGRMRVYQQDIDGAPLLIGENQIGHTPEGEDVMIYLGNAFDLVGERTQTGFRLISDTVMQETFEIRLRNRKETETVEIRVPERLSRWSNWEILNASMEYTQLDSATIEFVARVEPGAEVVITYTVQYSYPR